MIASPVVYGAFKGSIKKWLATGVVAAPLLLFGTAALNPSPQGSAPVATAAPSAQADPVAVVSPEKVEWLRLKALCTENMARRDAGYMGRLEPYCTQAETLREQATGIELSTAPGGTNF